MNVCLLTNQSYALATLLTAWEASSLSCTSKIIIIKYPDFNLPLFDEALRRIEKRDDIEIKTISLKNSPFSSYRGSAHFSDVVLAKFLLPEVINNDEFVFLDSGYIFTNREKFNDWLIKTASDFKASKKALAMHSNDISKGSNLRCTMRILFYSSSKYLGSNIRTRLLANFKNTLTQSKLKVPDQDLANITLNKHDYLRIKHLPEMTWDLVKWNELEDRGIRSYKDLKDSCSIFKFIGSIKPWQLWVLNPDKRIFLKRVKDMSDEINLFLYHIDAISLYSQIPTNYAKSSPYLPTTERERQMQAMNYNCLLAIK